MEQNELIKQKLLEIGEDYDALKPFMKAHLESVESFIENKQKSQKTALIALRESEYNVSEIAKALGYSRTTLYNHNQLLKRYIEYSIELDCKNNPIRMAEGLKTSKQRLQEQINLMENRDVDFEILKHENSLLLNTVAERDREIERLRNRVHELSTELHQHKQCSSQQPSIINFTND